MKVAISSQGESLSSALDPRFGRASGFVVVDTESESITYRDNTQNLSLSQGAGIQAAMNIADTGAEAVITGHVGPKAFAALSKGKIEIYYSQNSTVGEALEFFRKGQLTLAAGADRPGHW